MEMGGPPLCTAPGEDSHPPVTRIGIEPIAPACERVPMPVRALYPLAAHTQENNV